MSDAFIQHGMLIDWHSIDSIVNLCRNMSDAFYVCPAPILLIDERGKMVINHNVLMLSGSLKHDLKGCYTIISSIGVLHLAHLFP